MLAKSNATVPFWVWLYRFFIAPVLLFLVMLVGPFIKKVKLGLSLRMKSNMDDLSKNALWIHAASGEFEYAKPLLKAIKEKTSFPTMVTFFTPTYYKNIVSHPDVDQSLPLPLDLPGPLKSFLKRTKPICLLISRTDFWPEMLAQTILRKIPTYAFSVTQKSGGGISARLKAILLNMTDGVHCVSETDQQHLLAAGVTVPIWVSGDTRYDQVSSRIAHPQLSFEIVGSDSEKLFALTLVAGSTWPQDESVLLDAVDKMLKEKSLFLILVPHEPSETHFDSLKKSYPKLKIQRFSELADHSRIANQPGSVLYVDKVGVLADLYAVGDLAFVGGSFKSQVHSVMEPLAHGLPVVIGPKNKNNREAQEFQEIKVLAGNLQAVTAVTEVNDSDQLNSYLENVRKYSGQLDEGKSVISAEIKNRTGASEKILQFILNR